MCGIVGILGSANVTERLVAGLARLEYRGYDSAGVAVLQPDGVAMRRAVGKLDSLRVTLAANPLSGLIGIGHTRWATHGAATEANAHPHHAGPVTVVHNGIIENYADLRAELTTGGAVFSSQTDTEVVAQICARMMAGGLEPVAAVAATLGRIMGAYALVFIFDGEDDLMIAARQGSPLAIGYGETDAAGDSEMFVGSDALALAAFSQHVSYLDDGDMAVLTHRRTVILDRAGAEVVRPVQEIVAESWAVDKGPYRHFMAKEIFEQPESIARALRGLVNHQNGCLKPLLAGVDFTTADRVVLVACGTAHYACHIAKYWIERFASLPVEIEIASEFRYRDLALSGREIAIFVSQSGETADTLAALKHLRGRVAHRIAVVNVATSSIAREADQILEIAAGPEIGVASTKAFTGQLVVLAAIALAAAKARGRLSGAQEAELVGGLVALPRVVTDVLWLDGKIAQRAEMMVGARSAIFLGRGITYPLALEAALKLKEISYIHAEGYAAGELKHGPIALVDPEMPVVVFVPAGPLFEKTLSNAEEVAARGGRILLVTDQQGAELSGATSYARLELPDLPEAWRDAWGVIQFAVVAQLLAYHVAVLKGTDVDQPRNLAKSVTVE
ncbi:glutamine--fructose-6-phosphate transaminase (isomerizing) [Cypionkella sp.]|uniref:glutamine--fructose-6-phosphate transaminase (isomerizing) n=1 Tax=Cypionkella sp. TaxID=2811411 RepID=UPI000BD00BDE|nr:glutamine--fructose-6-phosphate transaminase (isomerizing) [Cypionkella sp.]MDO8982387.1 glutamine--fructose-6-phosphate transaminase (isomerizing) [Cypionkella sp.]MDP2050638.1 glutamine--fructose-6-phosphate transaminase (isomerizing) [Cypionkella sp.]OZA19917.1 MAG: glutamine--fructose-6-phosphate transaminase (isomerizing) [Rhodobacterales bacterium 17-64-5]